MLYSYIHNVLMSRVFYIIRDRESTCGYSVRNALRMLRSLVQIQSGVPRNQRVSHPVGGFFVAGITHPYERSKE